jgi:endonuclease III
VLYVLLLLLLLLLLLPLLLSWSRLTRSHLQVHIVKGEPEDVAITNASAPRPIRLSPYFPLVKARLQSQKQSHQREKLDAESESPPLSAAVAVASAAVKREEEQQLQRARERKQEQVVERVPVSETRFGLIQEALVQDVEIWGGETLYALCVQAILWNQTHGRMALPVLRIILARYPTPASLAAAELEVLTSILQPIGMHNRRARRLIALAQMWLVALPHRNRRYRRAGYPTSSPDAGWRQIGAKEVLDAADEREDAYEIAHLPGIGAYALDSYRIFYRDTLRGVAAVGGSEEWRKVVPSDKPLQAWLRWRWAKEGQLYDAKTGKTTPLLSGCGDVAV